MGEVWGTWAKVDKARVHLLNEGQERPSFLKDPERYTPSMAAGYG